MKAIIFSGGEIVASDLIRKAVHEADMVIAVDSGAGAALKLGITPQVVVGDMDSIDAESKSILEKKGIPCKVSPTEKDETDTELGILYAIEKGATEITLVGGTIGDRIDHILANIMYATVSTVPLTFLNGQQQSSVKKGPATISLAGKKDDLLSLIPLSEDVTGLDSSGLKWELHDGTLAFGMPRGVSNVLLEDHITLSWKTGWLFITHIHLSA